GNGGEEETEVKCEEDEEGWGEVDEGEGEDLWEKVKIAGNKVMGEEEVVKMGVI
ncbi:hypothetical protein B296_00056768, partial [Ensete ventricosum]